MTPEETKQAAAVERAKRIISQLIDALPIRRDWLDPVLEAEMKHFIAPEPMEVDVWVHEEGTVYCKNQAPYPPDVMERYFFRLRRATIHAEEVTK